jgi:hypothetical protein
MADSTQEDFANQYEHESGFDPALDLPLEPIPPDPPTKAKAGAADATPPAGPPKTPRKHLPGLVRRALAHGATREQIDAATPSDLDSWVEEQDIARESSRERNFHSQATGNAVDAQRRQQPAAAAAQVPEEDDETRLDRIAEEFGLDPKFISILKNQARELKELKGTVRGSVERGQAREKQERDAAFDSAFESLKMQKIFGDGDGNDLVGTKELGRRITIIKAANITDTDSPTVIRRKIAKAVDDWREVIGGGSQESQARGPYDQEEGEEPSLPRRNGNGKGRITPEQWNEATLARPTQRNTKEKKGRATAIRKVQEQITQNPDQFGDFDSFEEDGLPE